VGDGYGPRLVARERRPADPKAALASRLVGIPGELTTACLALRLYQSGARTKVLAFDAIEDAVVRGDVDVGLLIHEGQLTYADRGLFLWEDFGEWWAGLTGLPLPLGGNVVKRDLGAALVRDVARDLKASIVWGLGPRDETLAHAMGFARGMDAERTDRFVGMYVNDYTVDLRGVPTIFLGVKGCLYLTLWSRGNPRKGGPMESEIHSSNAVWIGSPVWRLVQALDTMVERTTQRPIVDGFWDDVRAPTKRDLEMVRALSKKFDPKAWLREERTAKFKYDLPKEELLRKYLFDPTINLCGLYAGYIEHGGTKTILPHEAYAKIDIRLVKDMTVEGTVRRLRAHLKKRGFEDLEIQVHGPYGPAKTDPDSWIARAAVDAVRAHDREPEVWPTSGGTMPAFAFDQYLKLPWVATGLGHGSRAHAPNEYASVDGMMRFMLGEASLLYAAASTKRTAPR
jgi:hypothetical protein